MVMVGQSYTWSIPYTYTSYTQTSAYVYSVKLNRFHQEFETKVQSEKIYNLFGTVLFFKS